MEKIFTPFEGQNNIKIIANTILVLMTRVLFIMVVAGCSKDGTLEEPDKINPLENQGKLLGSLEELENFYSVEFVDAMIALNFNTNLGNNPPNLEGSYLISPFILEDSTVEQDSAAIGGQFQDYLATFSNQDNKNLTIDLEGIQSSQTDNGNGSFVTGDNSSFAVYSKTATLQGSTETVTAVAISGILSPNGILKVQFYGAMLDDNGDPDGIFIENNTGRLLVDGDDFSPKQIQTSKAIGLDLSNWMTNLK
jgi:hypothetical protein